MNKVLKRLLVITLLVVVLVNVISVIKNNLESDKSERIKKAILDVAIQCYVVEGAYPNNLEYLKNYYGLIINDEEYIIYYECYSSNQIPSIKVLKTGNE